MKSFPWISKKQVAPLTNAWDEALNLADLSKIVHITTNVEWMSNTHNSIKGTSKTKNTAWNIMDFVSTLKDLAVDNYFIQSTPKNKWFIGPSTGDDGRIYTQYNCGFEGTPLSSKLEQDGKETLVVSGIHSRLTPYTTAMSGALNGYNVILLSDLCARGTVLPRPSQERKRAQEMSDAGVIVTTSDQFLSRLTAAPR